MMMEDDYTYLFEEEPKRKSFTKDELQFIEELPDVIRIECPICLHVMLRDPHLTSCCGHHFCGSCIERVKSNHKSCPICKESNYTTLPNKDRLRIIKGLQVYCTNKEIGCQWKGELKDLIGHLNDRKREGECRFQTVDCRYVPHCIKEDQRQHLDLHERNECHHRPYTCVHCTYEGTYQKITEEHYNKCPKYPVPCPNECEEGEVFERDVLWSHLSKECPLQPVECEFKWAGCHEKPLRKDLPQHVNDKVKDHLTLLATTCGEMKKENREMKTESEEMRKENKEMKTEIKEMKTELDEMKLNKELKRRRKRQSTSSNKVEIPEKKVALSSTNSTIPQLTSCIPSRLPHSLISLPVPLPQSQIRYGNPH